jgi:uncharacterized protein YndB with AHSA1/START domain
VPEVHIDVHLDHPVELAWHALTEPRALSGWFLPTDLTPTEGQTFSLLGGARFGLPETIRGEVMAVVPGQLLRMTWRSDFQQATALWELAPTPGGCVLRVTQSGFAAASLVPRRGLVTTAYRELFELALPQALADLAGETILTEADWLTAELAPVPTPRPEPVELNFAHNQPAAEPMSAVARWPRHRVVAAAACVLAAIVLGVVATRGTSIFSTGTSTPANPILVGAAEGPRPSASMAPTSTVSSAHPSPKPPHAPLTASPGESPSPTVTPSRTVAPTAPAAPVSASYHTTNTWDGGYSAEITLTATRSFPTWTVTITLPPAADVSTAWEAQVAGAAGNWTFTPQSWSADLAPGAPVTFGFQVDGDNGLDHPLSCAISGHGCAGL